MDLQQQCTSVHDQVRGTGLSDAVPWGGCNFGDALLEPTTIYVKRLLALRDAVNVKVRHLRVERSRALLSCFLHRGEPGSRTLLIIFGS